MYLVLMVVAAALVLDRQLLQAIGPWDFGDCGAGRSVQQEITAKGGDLALQFSGSV
jgi:hypothetical protein